MRQSCRSRSAASAACAGHHCVIIVADHSVADHSVIVVQNNILQNNIRAK